MSDSHRIDTGEAQFDLDAVGPLLPRIADVMQQISRRMWICYHAAQARNRPLAMFMVNDAISLMEKAAFLRPSSQTSMENFLDFEMERVRRAIDAEDWAAFDTAFALMTDSANTYHDLLDRPFIRWRVPQDPPSDLDLTPREGGPIK